MDLIVAAIPGFFATMGIEHAYLQRKADERGIVAGRYEKQDTLASLSMGIGSFLVPLALQQLLKPVTPGRGRYAKALVGTALGAAALTTVADVVVRATGEGLPEPGVVPRPGTVRAERPAAGSAEWSTAGSPERSAGVSTEGSAEGAAGVSADRPSGSPVDTAAGTSTGTDEGADPTGGTSAARPPIVAPERAMDLTNRRRRRLVAAARRVAGSSAVVAISAGVVAGSTAWAARTSATTIFRRSGHRRDLGTGALAAAVAILGWDFIYYWNHRFMHESRYMWAIHVVHHSSERYNLSTALRQPVAGDLALFVPYGLLAFLGVRPSVIETARGINLLYQYWIHTEAIGKLGPAEEVLNTASHHRVHHGSNRQYLDRNHGSILIVWDRLFGTFEREDEPVVYGLTKNIDTFNPARIATHEYADMVRDVAGARTWRDRLGFVLRGPGWAHARRGEPDPRNAPTPSPTPAVA